jgi:HAD superfamily hydrolase (TIGR01549 family)
MFSTIILDFDGIILESVNVKTEAFRELFSSEPEKLEEIVEFHKRNGGMSRYDKFRYIYSHILQKELTDTQFKHLSDKFADLVYENVIKTSFVPGAQEFLQNNYRKFSLYVVSATPEDELRRIVEKRGLTVFFHDVYGAPINKTDHIRNILSATHCRKENTLFIGDAMNDLKAAVTSGICFIGRVPPGEHDYFTGNPAVEHTISTLFDLENIIYKETIT